MFRKLLKYDLGSVARLWWIGAVTSVAAALAGSFLIRFSNSVSEHETNNGWLLFAAAAARLVFFACIAAIFISFIFTLILVFVRFYRHFFTDEGYLTFTLPVKRSTLLLSKTANAAIWFCAQFAVTGISVLLILMIGAKPEGGGFLNLGFFEEVREFFVFGWEAIGAWLIVYTAEALLGVAVYLAYSILLVYFCITFGAVIAKKAKIIASIGVYYAVTVLLGTIGQFCLMLLAAIMVSGAAVVLENAPQDQICTVVSFVILAVVCAIASLTALFYSVTQLMLDRKLNLA